MPKRVDELSRKSDAVYEKVREALEDAGNRMGDRIEQMKAKLEERMPARRRQSHTGLKAVPR